MSTLAPATDTALSALSVFATVALKIELPANTIRLLDGALAAYIDGELYTGRDDIFGVYDALEPISDGVDNEAPTLQFVILPPSNTAMAALAAPEAQGSPVTVVMAVIDPVSGLAIGDSIPLFAGEIDQATNKVGKGTKLVQINCISVFDRFLLSDEGSKLNNAFHQSIWPGELGLEFISAVDVRNPWGSDAPRTTLTPNNQAY